MTLCKPEVIDKLNHYFVPVYMSFRPQPEEFEFLSEEGVREVFDTVRHAFDAHPQDLIQTFVLTPSGELVRADYPMLVDPTQAFEANLDECIRQMDLRPGPALVRYRSHAEHDPGPDGIQLHVVLRYADPDLMKKLPMFHPSMRGKGRYLYWQSLQAPTRDWITLRQEEWRVLLPPPGAGVGKAYDVDPALAEQILVHFRPEPSRLDPPRAPDARISAVLASTEGDLALVHLAGPATFPYPGLQTEAVPEFDGRHNDGNWVQVNLQGTRRYDRRTGDLQDLQLATTQAAYCTPEGDRLQMEGAAYLVPRQMCEVIDL